LKPQGGVVVVHRVFLGVGQAGCQAAKVREGV